MREARTFAARYSSECGDPGCSERIEVGDEVKWADDGGVVHAGCLAVAEDTLEVVGGVCTGCWTERSVSGVCGCD